jgi:hypothetical protein
VKHPPPRHGQRVHVLGTSEVFRVVALIVAPVETLLVSRDGTVFSAHRLDPAQWAGAMYDVRRECWLVPPEEGPEP